MYTFEGIVCLIMDNIAATVYCNEDRFKTCFNKLYLCQGLFAATTNNTLVNKAVLCGHQATLVCPAGNKTTAWYYFDNSFNQTLNNTCIETRERILFNGHRITQKWTSGNRFSVDNQSTGLSKLLINATQLQDAGIYRCVDAGSSSRFDLLLVVIGNLKHYYKLLFAHSTIKVIKSVIIIYWFCILRDNTTPLSARNFD